MERPLAKPLDEWRETGDGRRLYGRRKKEGIIVISWKSIFTVVEGEKWIFIDNIIIKVSCVSYYTKKNREENKVYYITKYPKSLYSF